MRRIAVDTTVLSSEEDPPVQLQRVEGSGGRRRRRSSSPCLRPGMTGCGCRTGLACDADCRAAWWLRSAAVSGGAGGSWKRLAPRARQPARRLGPLWQRRAVAAGEDTAARQSACFAALESSDWEPLTGWCCRFTTADSLDCATRKMHSGRLHRSEVLTWHPLLAPLGCAWAWPPGWHAACPARWSASQRCQRWARLLRRLQMVTLPAAALHSQLELLLLMLTLLQWCRLSRWPVWSLACCCQD